MILRVTHSSHRSEAQIQGEMDWIQHLGAAGVPVSAPLVSIHGQTVEQLGAFLITAFERAPGQHPQLHEWGEELFREWGRTIGAMHRAAALYEFDSRRPHWTEEYNVAAIHEVLAHDPELIACQRQLLEELHALPQNRSSFGMVHSDFEDGNFFLYEGRIHPFDFDECQYHWFAYDIGNSIRAASWILPLAAPSYTLEQFAGHFLDGYRQEHVLEAFWVRQLPLFIRLRELCIYVYLHGKRDVQKMSEEEQAYLRQMRSNIVCGVSCVSMNFAEWAHLYV
nr:phosphotransferase [Ectobacillus ponti]